MIEPKTRVKAKILLVEDSPTFISFVRELFKASPAFAKYDIDLDCVTTLREAETSLGTGQYDLVLLDLNLSNGVGEETIRRASAASSGAEPIIVLTGRGCPETAAMAIENGMAGFVLKSEMGPLGASLAERMGRALVRAARDPQRRGRISDVVAEETKRLRGPSQH